MSLRKAKSPLVVPFTVRDGSGGTSVLYVGWDRNLNAIHSAAAAAVQKAYDDWAGRRSIRDADKQQLMREAWNAVNMFESESPTLWPRGPYIYRGYTIVNHVDGTEQDTLRLLLNECEQLRSIMRRANIDNTVRTGSSEWHSLALFLALNNPWGVQIAVLSALPYKPYEGIQYIWGANVDNSKLDSSGIVTTGGFGGGRQAALVGGWGVHSDAEVGVVTTLSRAPNTLPVALSINDHIRRWLVVGYQSAEPPVPKRKNTIVIAAENGEYNLGTGLAIEQTPDQTKWCTIQKSIMDIMGAIGFTSSFTIKQPDLNKVPDNWVIWDNTAKTSGGWKRWFDTPTGITAGLQRRRAVNALGPPGVPRRRPPRGPSGVALDGLSVPRILPTDFRVIHFWKPLFEHQEWHARVLRQMYNSVPVLNVNQNPRRARVATRVGNTQGDVTLAGIYMKNTENKVCNLIPPDVTAFETRLPIVASKDVGPGYWSSAHPSHVEYPYGGFIVQNQVENELRTIHVRGGALERRAVSATGLQPARLLRTPEHVVARVFDRVDFAEVETRMANLNQNDGSTRQGEEGEEEKEAEEEEEEKVEEAQIRPMLNLVYTKYPLLECVFYIISKKKGRDAFFKKVREHWVSCPVDSFNKVMTGELSDVYGEFGKDCGFDTMFDTMYVKDGGFHVQEVKTFNWRKNGYWQAMNKSMGEYTQFLNQIVSMYCLCLFKQGMPSVGVEGRRRQEDNAVQCMQTSTWTLMSYVHPQMHLVKKTTSWSMQSKYITSASTRWVDNFNGTREISMDAPEDIPDSTYVLYTLDSDRIPGAIDRRPPRAPPIVPIQIFAQQAQQAQQVPQAPQAPQVPQEQQAQQVPQRTRGLRRMERLNKHGRRWRISGVSRLNLGPFTLNVYTAPGVDTNTLDTMIRTYVKTNRAVSFGSLDSICGHSSELSDSDRGTILAALGIPDGTYDIRVLRSWHSAWRRGPGDTEVYTLRALNRLVDHVVCNTAYVQQRESHLEVCQRYARGGAWRNFNFTRDSQRNLWSDDMIRLGKEVFTQIQPIVQPWIRTLEPS